MKGQTWNLELVYTILRQGKLFTYYIDLSLMSLSTHGSCRGKQCRKQCRVVDQDFCIVNYRPSASGRRVCYYYTTEAPRTQDCRGGRRVCYHYTTKVPRMNNCRDGGECVCTTPLRPLEPRTARAGRRVC